MSWKWSSRVGLRSEGFLRRFSSGVVGSQPSESGRGGSGSVGPYISLEEMRDGGGEESVCDMFEGGCGSAIY